MRRPLPPLNALRAFEATARHLSFSKAAEELHVTPAALSHQIRGLEDVLGLKLFVRRPRSIERNHYCCHRHPFTVYLGVRADWHLTATAETRDDRPFGDQRGLR